MTPFDAISKIAQDITWGQVCATILPFVSGAIAVAVWFRRIHKSLDYVEQMATNDFPHTFHTLLNIDKNIAKMTGGDVVNFTELELELAKKRLLKK